MTTEHTAESPKEFSGTPSLLCIGLMLLIYVATLLFHLPQAGTHLIVEAAHHSTHSAEHPEESAAEKMPPPAIWMVFPFVVLLGCIAVLPLMHATEHWWESNLHRFYVAGGLGLLTLIFYLVAHEHPVQSHYLSHEFSVPTAGGLNFDTARVVLENAMLEEYIPFIVLLFSLYTITGGVRIEGDLVARPSTNVAFIGIGATIASFVGTTGAAMLLIRPLLETNRERKHVKHTVIFFIFAVCNCGGCLLPIGDPPLFLGYLEGVPFLWTFALWKEWLFVNSLLLIIYYVWDRFIAYPKESQADLARDTTDIKPLKFKGVLNIVWLFGVILAVALLDPKKTILGWHPWLYMREMVQMLMVGLSLLTTSKAVRTDNNFNFAAIIEVAVLFSGIFICMQPALQILDVRGAELPITTAQRFFWATGSLSAVLDNAPTYLVFFNTAKSLSPASGPHIVAGVEEHLLIAMSLGAVFMGAMTYIGNGPNFMVKAIAETEGVKMPSFFGFTAYSFGVLLPIFILTVLLFL